MIQIDDAFSSQPKIAIKRPLPEYTPWNQSYEKAVVCASLALFVLWIGQISGAMFGAGKSTLVFTSMALMGVSILFFSRGMSREFGKNFELKWVEKAKSAFRGTRLSVGQSRMTKGGDIDVLVDCGNGNVVNVEIKSWRSYGDDDKYLRREKQGLSQIHAQRGAIHAVASVLWLPQARESFFQSMFGGNNKIDDETFLCRGNARRLRKLIERISK